MHHPIVDKIRDRYSPEYTIHEHEHDVTLWYGLCAHYVELQYGGDMTLVVVRRRTDNVYQDPLVGMPYRCGPDEDEIFERIDRALETVQYHAE
jgi:hypothetical protein